MKKPLSLKGVEPNILLNPIGIDALVKDMQIDFRDNIPWLTKSFNRADITARLQPDGEGGNGTFIFPKCWVADGYDELEMIGLDNWNAYSFFATAGNETRVGEDNFDGNTYTRILSLYVWMNLDAINPTRSGGYFEELKRDVLDRLREFSYDSSFGIEVSSIVDNSLEVFNGFTTAVDVTQFIVDPYRALRIDLDAYYPDKPNC